MRSTILKNPATLILPAAVFLSAFLLFQVQPLIGKAVLPRFGGTPAVWSACLVFFQLALFGGYLYSHLIAARLPTRLQATVHLALLVTAVVMLRVLPGPASTTSQAGSPVGQIVLLLAATVGLPYFVLSTTGPLLQWWFSRLEPGKSPYRLYALSNAGSLLALLSYPFVIEPLFPLSVQARIWSVGFWVFVALCAMTAVRLWIAPAPADAESQSVGSTAAPSVGRQLMWLGLAMVPSALLLAITNHVSQDAVVPFLWVVPLSLYLLSFILCFDSDRWYRRENFAWLALLLITSAAGLAALGWHTYLSAQIISHFAALFAICMLCHGELSKMRPASGGLTRFYLILSAGGAAGGLFVALVAPRIFDDEWELYLGLAVSALICVLVSFDAMRERDAGVHWKLLTISGAIFVFTLLGVVITDSVLARKNRIATRRNFYGILEVERRTQYPDKKHKVQKTEESIILRHGQIIHGLQYSDPAIRFEPTTYYPRSSGVGLAIAALQSRKPSVKCGLVGLGVGTLAAYGRTGDTVRFYEINDNVVQLAREQFSFLDGSKATVEIVPGDARLSLEGEAPQGYDLLVVDAFSGDAIPTHLLTREAMVQYVRHLNEKGIIAFHISNLYFELQPVIDALADEFQMRTYKIEHRAEDRVGDRPSTWMLVTRDETIATDAALKDRIAKPQTRRILWTDDFTNILQTLSW
jgi:hypothetical protein